MLQAPKKTTNIKDGLRSKAGLAIETPTEVSVQKDAVEAGRKSIYPKTAAPKLHQSSSATKN